jgi:thiol-disulfide isomerase/thioredoxin
VTMRVLSALLLLFLALMSFNQCARPPAPGTGSAELDQVAPPFILADLNGQEVSLDQYRGKIVMLDFWATWCGPCRMTMPILEKLQKEYRDGLTLLDINIQESPELVRPYVRKQNIKATVLLDQRGSVSAAYGSNSIPMQVLIDRQGIIRHIQVGYGANMEAQLRAEINKLL